MTPITIRDESFLEALRVRAAWAWSRPWRVATSQLAPPTQSLQLPLAGGCGPGDDGTADPKSPPPSSTPFPYATLFRSEAHEQRQADVAESYDTDNHTG